MNRPIKNFKSFIKEETVQVYTILVDPNVSAETLNEAFYEMWGFTTKQLDSGNRVLITARPIENGE